MLPLHHSHMSATFLFQGKLPTRQIMPLGQTLKVQSYRLQLLFLLDLRSSPTEFSTFSIPSVDPNSPPS